MFPRIKLIILVTYYLLLITYYLLLAVGISPAPIGKKLLQRCKRCITLPPETIKNIDASLHIFQQIKTSHSYEKEDFTHTPRSMLAHIKPQQLLLLRRLRLRLRTLRLLSPSPSTSLSWRSSLSSWSKC